MNNLWLIGISFILGIIMRRSGRLPHETSRALGGFIIFVSLPALILLHIHNLEVNKDLLLAAAMPWFLFFLSWALFGTFIKDRRTAGSLILTAGLGNTSFLGIPLITAWFGESGIPAGIMADQLGTFLVLSVPGTYVLVKYSAQGEISASYIIKKIFYFPPFLALTAAFLLRPFAYPEAAESVLKSLGSTLTPLALVTAGFQINIKELKDEIPYLSAGLGWKLLSAPLITAIVWSALIPWDSELYKVTVFEAAMPPMITACILAMEYNLRPSLAAAMMGAGTVISFFTTTGIALLLNLF